MINESRRKKKKVEANKHEGDDEEMGHEVRREGKMLFTSFNVK